MSNNVITIGIQGGKGSTNERAAKDFILRQGWDEDEVVLQYLYTSDKVISSVLSGKSDYGVFAFRSKSLLVKETIQALEKYDSLSVTIVDEVALVLDHALFARGDIDPTKPIYIYSHLQALKIHEQFLRNHFSTSELHFREEIDTAEAVKKLAAGEYPENTLAIGPIGCKHLYSGVSVVLSHLPSNHDYLTKFWLIARNPEWEGEKALP